MWPRWASAAVEVHDRDDVLDPAGHDGDVYDKVVDELWELCQDLDHPSLTDGSAAPRRCVEQIQSAWTERNPAQARSDMRWASRSACSSMSASESDSAFWAMKRRLAPSAMPTIP